MKVSVLWRMLTLILIGFSIGVFVTVKYISPPSQDITIGKIKIKGTNNSTDGMVHIAISDKVPDQDPVNLDDKKPSKIKSFFSKIFRKKDKNKGQDPADP